MTRNILIIIALCLGIFALEYFTSQSPEVSTTIVQSGSVQTGSQVSQTGWVSQVSDSVRSKVSKILQDTEVIETLDRIDRTKPRYRQDNAIFTNRERRLQIQTDRSYYREWTVETPGSRDRGPRRIIVGEGWEVYFSDDHYRSFTRIR